MKGQEIKYILFDCDNTLAKSEKLAFQACAELTNTVLAKHGHGDVKYDGTTLLHEFVGQNFRGMIKSLEAKLNFTVDPKELDDYVDQEVVVVTAKLAEFATECPGAVAQVEALHGKIPMVRKTLTSYISLLFLRCGLN
jgi:phosphoglycolate phosphatase-like HAD superfamily hydrolase